MQEMFQQVEKFKKDQIANKNDLTKEVQRLAQDMGKMKDYQPAPIQVAANPSTPPT